MNAITTSATTSASPPTNKANHSSSSKTSVTLSIWGITDNLGLKQQTNVITEAGLYEVIFMSRKPEAKAFRRWVTSEVLPSIRKHGHQD